MAEITRNVSVVVNGLRCQVAVGETIAELLDQLEITPKGCAVAVNAEVLPRSVWPTRVICENDEIEVLTAAPGG